MRSSKFGKVMGPPSSPELVVISTKPLALREEAAPIPENPIKDYAQVDMSWIQSWNEKKRDGHKTVSQKHLLRGHTENAERHRELARAYGQTAEEIESFVFRRQN
jgi:hypothetical protein